MFRLILITFFLSNFIFAQNINLKLIKTETENFPNVVSALQVYDNYDEPIDDLQPKDFKITLSGKYADSIKFTTYKKSGLGIKVVLCIDVSRTMTGKPFESLKNAVKKYIDKLRSTDKLSIFTFGDDVKMVSDFSNDKQYLRELINSIQPDGNYTELYSGLYKAVKKLVDDKEKEGKIVVVISDGKDESKTKTYTDKDVIDIARENGIPVFSIGYTKIDKIYLQSLEKISDNTNGKFYYSPDENELERQYEKMYNQIQNIYLINYVFYDFAGDGNEHTHTITVNKNGNVKSVSNRVIIPSGVMPLKKQEKLISDNENFLIYYIIGGIGLIILVTLLIVLKKKKKEVTPENSKIQADQIDFKVEIPRKEQEFQEGKLEKETSDKTVIESDRTQIAGILDDSGDKTVIIGNELTTARLEFKIGLLAGQTFILNKDVFKIGRKSDNHLIINDKTVSGYHSEIIFDGHGYIIIDKGSTNGTFVNGIRVSQQRLQSGDAKKIGGNEGYFLI